MESLHVIIISLIQGITEFLPISSSAHLILLPQLLHWEDQGMTVDVAAHIGTLLAVVCYFIKDLKLLTFKSIEALHFKKLNAESLLLIQLGIATIPVCIVGFLFHDFVAEYLRSPIVIAWSTIIFGLVLALSDVLSKKLKSIDKLSFKHAFWIGCAQVLALIPGTSRSGITMTAALALGFNRVSAARFSFLLAIPVITLAGGLESLKLIQSSQSIAYIPLFSVIILSFLSALLCIHFFLKFIQRVGMLPFVVYRFALGGLLLFLFL